MHHSMRFLMCCSWWPVAKIAGSGWRLALPRALFLWVVTVSVCRAESESTDYQRWVEEDRQQGRAWLLRDGGAGYQSTSETDAVEGTRERWLSAEEIEAETNRPATWAQPVPLEGVDNFHKVSEVLYRGAQPTAEGMQSLHAMGIRTVVSLRAFHSDRDEIGDLELRHERIPMKAWNLRRKDVLEFLAIVTDPHATPVMVHCLRGSDRTGAMCTAYRIVVQGWTKEEAIREMLKGGYGFYAGWENIPERLFDFDVAAIRSELRIADPPVPAPDQVPPTGHFRSYP